MKTLKCPHCGVELPKDILAKAWASIAGGASGKRKARSPEQARAAAKKLWAIKRGETEKGK